MFTDKRGLIECLTFNGVHILSKHQETGNFRGHEGLTGQEKVDHNSRREGALPLTPQPKELSPVKDHRYRMRRRRGEESRGKKRTVTVTVMTKAVCERGETSDGRLGNRRWKERRGSSWGEEGVR